MARPPFEVADVFRSSGEAYRQLQGQSLPLSHLRVMQAIESCRTAALGGHVDACTACGARVISYNSCRNRHCPKCQSTAKDRWLDARLTELLPVEYFHVVFTLPEEIAQLGLQNKRLIYNLLFQATAETLQTIAADPKHLGAQIGFLAVLHTWGQTLTFHPHLHCIVPGGGFGPNGWISCRPGFFLPVRVLSRCFRRAFLNALNASFRQGKLHFFGELAPLCDPQHFAQWLKLSRKNEWVVYAKKPFGGPRQVLNYLGRYTHRVAIANHRLQNVTRDHVTFHWRDYRHAKQLKTMTLEAHEFIRRFLLHVLPDGFVRIRHFGFLANRCRSKNIERARRLLNAPRPDSAAKTSLHSDQQQRHNDITLCPVCQKSHLLRLQALPPHVRPTLTRNDSS
jgi:Putative transposase/Transposase zinc-binding domain